MTQVTETKEYGVDGLDQDALKAAVATTPFGSYAAEAIGNCIRAYLDALERRASDKPSEAVAWRWRYVRKGVADLHWVVRQSPIEPVAETEHWAGIEVEPLFTSSEAGVARLVQEKIAEVSARQKAAFDAGDDREGNALWRAHVELLGLQRSLSTLTPQPAESAKSGDGVTIDDEMLARAEAAWRASVAPTCKLMMRDALRAALGDHRND